MADRQLITSSAIFAALCSAGAVAGLAVVGAPVVATIFVGVAFLLLCLPIGILVLRASERQGFDNWTRRSFGILAAVVYAGAAVIMLVRG